MTGRPAHTKMTARAAKALERQGRAIELRAMGLTYREIGERLDCSVSSVQKVLAAAIKKTLQKPADEVRQQEAEKMDAIWRRMWANISNDPTDYKAYDVLLRLLKRRAALFGLDAPVKREISGPDGGPIEVAPSWRDGALLEAASDADIAKQLDGLAETLGQRLEAIEERRMDAKAIEVKAEVVDGEKQK